MTDTDAKKKKDVSDPERRRFLDTASSTAMVAGLAAGYGGLALVGARYLYPADNDLVTWIFVTPVDELPVGSSLKYRTPTGHPVVITRHSDLDRPESFLALSSTCPHLGCQVKWEAHNQRYFCPCHNGVFDPLGEAVEGPPAQANQALPAYRLKIERRLLYIEVEKTELNLGQGRIEEAPRLASKPGHDPCLQGHKGGRA